MAERSFFPPQERHPDLTAFEQMLNDVTSFPIRFIDHAIGNAAYAITGTDSPILDTFVRPFNVKNRDRTINSIVDYFTKSQGAAPTPPPAPVRVPKTPEEIDALIFGAQGPNSAAGVLNLAPDVVIPLERRMSFPSGQAPRMAPTQALPTDEEIQKINALNDAISAMDIPAFTDKDRQEITMNNLLGGLSAGMLDAVNSSQDMGEAISRIAIGALGGYTSAQREIRKEEKLYEISEREKLVADMQRSQENLARVGEFKARYRDIEYKNRVALYQYETAMVDWTRPDIRVASDGTTIIQRNVVGDNGQTSTEIEVLTPPAVAAAQQHQALIRKMALSSAITKREMAKLQTSPARTKMLIFAEAAKVPLTGLNFMPRDQAEALEEEILASTMMIPSQKGQLEAQRRLRQAKLLSFYQLLLDPSNPTAEQDATAFGSSLSQFVISTKLQAEMDALEELD